MPVTAKLSREFYDRLGDKVVDELVGLLNDVDATFKAELREQNDRNLALFDAKLEQRLTELKAELSVMLMQRVLSVRKKRREKTVADLPQ